MRANSSSSLMVSLMLHAFVVGGLILATYIVARQTKEPPVIFELVAGEGNQVNELEAPALGNTPNPVKLDAAPRPDPTPPSAPEPVVQTQPEETAPETPPPVEKAPTKAPTKAPDKPKPDKPKVDKSIAQEMNKKARISYKDYLKKHPTPKKTASTSTASGKASTGPRVDAQGIAAGVQGGSKSNTRGGAGGKAMSREEADQMSTYISLLIQELKKAHEPPPGVSDRFETKVSFDITASGAILNPRIVKSSGDKTFDQSVLDAFLRMRSIGPTPNRRPDNWTVTFRMRDEA